jgi:hypothetical protein
MRFLVSIKPADGPGPVLVSDDPTVLDAAIQAIRDVYSTGTKGSSGALPQAGQNA